MALCLDDREQSLGSAGHESSWREWLRLSNLMAFKPRGLTIGSVLSDVSAGDASAEAAQVEAAQAVALDWLELLADAMEDEKEDLLRLAGTGLRELPKLGFEVDGYPADFAWPDRQVAVVYDADAASTFQAAGWKTTTDIDDIRELLKTEGA